MQPVEGDISGEKRNEERDLWIEIGKGKRREREKEPNLLHRARPGQMEPMMACFFSSLSGGDCIHLHRELRHFG